MIKETMIFEVTIVLMTSGTYSVSVSLKFLKLFIICILVPLALNKAENLMNFKGCIYFQTVRVRKA